MVSLALAVAPGVLPSFPTRRSSDLVRVEPPAAVLGVGVASSDRVVATLGWFCTTRVSLQGLEGKRTRLKSSHSASPYQVPAVEKEWAAESGARWLVTVLVAGVWSTALLVDLSSVS